jgi:hypothetical protein
MHVAFRPAARFAARHAPSAIALLTLSAFAACSDSTAVGRGGSQLGFTTSSSVSSGAAAASLDAAPITKNGHTIVLKQVTIVVERAQLKQQSTNACAGDEDDDNQQSAGPTSSSHTESCASVKIGPTLVDLPLDAGMTTLPMDVIPPGTYQQIEFRVSLARLVGTFDGNAFDVTIPVNVRSEIQFATPVVVTAGTPTSITINVPLDAWLTNPDGSLVDPRQLLTNSTLAAAVKARIQASFHAFQDDDHNGKDDHDRGDGD